MSIPLLILINLAAHLLWSIVLHWGWALLKPAGIPYPTFALLAGAGGLLYSFLILLLDKFLIQNRTDALPLRITRMSFAFGVLLYPVVLLLLRRDG